MNYTSILLLEFIDVSYHLTQLKAINNFEKLNCVLNFLLHISSRHNETAVGADPPELHS